MIGAKNFGARLDHFRTSCQQGPKLETWNGVKIRRLNMPSFCVWRQSRPCESVRYCILSRSLGTCPAIPVGGALADSPFPNAFRTGGVGGQVILARAVAWVCLALRWSLSQVLWKSVSRFTKVKNYVAGNDWLLRPRSTSSGPSPSWGGR